VVASVEARDAARPTVAVGWPRRVRSYRRGPRRAAGPRRSRAARGGLSVRGLQGRRPEIAEVDHCARSQRPLPVEEHVRVLRHHGSGGHLKRGSLHPRKASKTTTRFNPIKGTIQILAKTIESNPTSSTASSSKWSHWNSSPTSGNGDATSSTPSAEHGVAYAKRRAHEKSSPKRTFAYAV
jgi:hypothetical protein